MGGSSLTITRKVDYALRAMVFLAGLTPVELRNFETIATAYQIPKDFLAKIMRQLVQAELVQSIRGPRGGYKLNRPAYEISVLEVVEAVEGPIFLNHCLDDGDPCSIEARCSMMSVWERAQQAMTEVLRTTLLSDIADFDCAIKHRDVRSMARGDSDKVASE
jgi:Rrf2 family protein